MPWTVVVVGVVNVVLADAGDGWHMGGWWVIMPIIGVIFMMVMMRGMFGMSRRGRGRMGPMDMCGYDGHGDESALDVLRRRYAAGELGDEEFDAMRKKLEKGADVAGH